MPTVIVGGRLYKLPTTNLKLHKSAKNLGLGWSLLAAFLLVSCSAQGLHWLEQGLTYRAAATSQISQPTVIELKSAPLRPLWQDSNLA
jgi:hypothetical protein